MFLSHSPCVTAWTTSIHWCELGVRRIVWIVMSCQELSKIVTPMWWLYCCASKVPTRLTIADADEYYEIGHYTHEDIYTYMMKIENAFLCWVPLWVKQIPTLSRGPVGVGTPCEWTMILTSSEMSTFSLCVCLFVTKKMSFFTLCLSVFLEERALSHFEKVESKK